MTTWNKSNIGMENISAKIVTLLISKVNESGLFN